MHLLGISGSLRAASTNSALLRAAARAAPEGVTLTLFEGLGSLPIFNPDLEDGPMPAVVVDLRQQVQAADGLVIACPEYAHGVPGGLKNALDWLVSGAEIPGKPIALFHASARSQHGRLALADVLRTMSTRIVCEFTLPLLGRGAYEVERLLSAPDAVAALASTLRAVQVEIERSSDPAD